MTLNENDFLTFQLYTASKTPRIKRNRIRSWVITTVMFLSLSYLCYDSENDFLGAYFLVLAGLALVLFPLYTRWRYKRHYLKYIRDTYKNRFGEKCELEIDEDTIGAKDKTGVVKLNKSEIEEVNEIKDYYFLKSRSGLNLIVSKTKSDDIEVIMKEIKSLVETRGVRHNIELDWKWK
jgi:hypothetical protein